ncbi:MAG: extracellular solute-binding protein [Alphaproteobacteria bacterium]|nr:MAG: extracellular solute-binding protein [Alphaproteobacteria bacterium]
MRERRFSRRDVLKSSAAAVSDLLASPARAAALEPTAITPSLVAAARKEGRLFYYTSIDLPLAEKIAKSFESAFPGIAVRVERSGAERVFQRIGQEYASRIYGVDVVNSSDAAHFIVWKREGILAPFVPADVAMHYPADHHDPDGMFASFRVSLSPIAYNTNLVKREEAPKSYAATFQIVRELGWGYLEKLAKQKVMQVQSGTDPPKKLALGERAVMADGGEYNVLQSKEGGGPVEVVYPTEGTPLVVGPNAMFKNAPNPNAARLFQCYCFTPECQQLIVDFGALRSMHPLVKEKTGRRPFRDIKIMKEDPAGVEKASEDIKARYSRLFGV